MLHQKQILDWLKHFTCDQIKQIITIKNPSSLTLLQSILTHKKQDKPIDYISHGYCKTHIQNQASTIYVRDKFRYKNPNKQAKKKMDQVLFQNIVISRNQPYSFSVRKSFIKTGQLSQCMLLLSQEQIFNYLNANYRESVWFNQKSINSFSQWLIHLFELEILQAYHHHQHPQHQQLIEINRFYYLNQIVKKQQIVQSIKTIIYHPNFLKSIKKQQQQQKQKPKEISQKQNKPLLFIKVEERQYLLGRCLDKLQPHFKAQSSLQVKVVEVGEVIFQYQWISDEPFSQINLIFQEISHIFHARFQNYKIDLKIQEIEMLNLNKKKKKKVKKNNINTLENNIHKQQDNHKKQEQSNFSQLNTKEIGNKNKQKQAPKQPQKQSIVLPHQINSGLKSKQVKNTEKKKQIKKENMAKINSKDNKDHKKQEFIQTEQSQKLQKQIKQKQKSKIVQTKLNKSKNTEMKMKQGNKNQRDEKQLNQKLIKIQKSKQKKMKEQIKKNKKVVNQRINEYIHTFYQQLTEHSNQQHKYRQICLQIIQNTIEQLQIPSTWKLQLFGSVSINFALKQSDLDLVLHIQKSGCCNLSDIYDIFRARQWVRSCNIIKQARVPIVQFEIVLADVKHIKIKDYKKIFKQLIHVDISIFSGNDYHEGVNNTIFLKQIFDENQSLMVTCLIFKQLLRIYRLNKPYKGGIGSYSLVILTYNILKMKNIEIDSNYIKQILAVTNFLNKEFEPYVTLITPFKHSKVTSNPQLILNIQDPHDHVLVNTNARLISQILLIFQRFADTLLQIEQQILTISPQQRKKMKRMFFQRWNNLFQVEVQVQEEHIIKQNV